jgi:hypothetical protein
MHSVSGRSQPGATVHAWRVWTVAPSRRGGERSARIAVLLEACVIEPLLQDLARVAGEAIATVKGQQWSVGSSWHRGRSTRPSSFDCGLRSAP